MTPIPIRFATSRTPTSAAPAAVADEKALFFRYALGQVVALLGVRQNQVIVHALIINPPGEGPWGCASCLPGRDTILRA